MRTGDKQLDDALIIHFNGPNKPWIDDEARNAIDQARYAAPRLWR